MEEVELAATSAHMHDRIMSFPDGKSCNGKYDILSDAMKAMRPKLVNAVSD